MSHPAAGGSKPKSVNANAKPSVTWHMHMNCGTRCHSNTLVSAALLGGTTPLGGAYRYPEARASV